tara:strand:+ start:333 stop:527 length:195 start_codon:yes stop_codon:yes gene_type:complete
MYLDTQYTLYGIYIVELVVGNWDKVEKSKRATTQQDINWLYIKTGMFVLVSIAYFYFIIMGWTL